MRLLGTGSPAAATMGSLGGQRPSWLGARSQRDAARGARQRRRRPDRRADRPGRMGAPPIGRILVNDIQSAWRSPSPVGGTQLPPARRHAARVGSGDPQADGDQRPGRGWRRRELPLTRPATPLPSKRHGLGAQVRPSSASSATAAARLGLKLFDLRRRRVGVDLISTREQLLGLAVGGGQSSVSLNTDPENGKISIIEIGAYGAQALASGFAWSIASPASSRTITTM